MKSNYQDLGRYQEVDLDIAGDAEASLPTLIEQVKKLTDEGRKAAFEARGKKLAAAHLATVEQAKSGHPGMPMGMADIATVLFTQFLRFDPQTPDWPDRDRFVLSNGHGSMLLYGLLHLTGYPVMTLDELKRFRQLGSRTAGHPERGHARGIETTTGPLGQGLGNSVGMGLAERMLAAEFGEAIVNHHTYVFVGDGCGAGEVEGCSAAGVRAV